MDKNTGWIADLMRRFDDDVQATHRDVTLPDRERDRLYRERSRAEAEQAFRRLLGILRGERPARDAPGMLPMPPAR